ncbi:MAG: alpha/beta hydrolase fold domain-containing protein [Tepidiformaceae bacterium]
MTAPDSGRVTIEEGVVFGTGGGRDLKCDIFTPPGSPTNAPAILLLHGGGWSGGDRSQLRGYGILPGRLGYVCVASEYRLSGEAPWPAQIHDSKAALRWMRANASRLGIDPSRIAVSGNSAGAHLSLMVAGTPNMPEFEGVGGNPGVDTSVAASVAIYAPVQLGGPVALSEAVSALMGPNPTVAALAGASPITHASATFPPTLLIHGNADELVPSDASLQMYRALRAAGVPAEVHIYADQPHAFDAAPAFGRQCAAVMDLFFQRYLGAAGAAASGGAIAASPVAASARA